MSPKEPVKLVKFVKPDTISAYQPSWLQNKPPPPRNTVSLLLEEPKPKFGRRNALNGI